MRTAVLKEVGKPDLGSDPESANLLDVFLDTADLRMLYGPILHYPNSNPSSNYSGKILATVSKAKSL